VNTKVFKVRTSGDICTYYKIHNEQKHYEQQQQQQTYQVDEQKLESL
jgi:hypothetical protein